MVEYSRVGYRIRLAAFDGDEQFAGFWKSLTEEVTSLGKQDFTQLFETMKSRIRQNIDEDRKAKFFPSPTGYVPGGLGRSAHYRIREYKSRKGVSLRGFFTIGDNIPYAAIHDRDGETTIHAQSAPLLTFFNHATGQWVRTKSVSRPGSPYFDDAVNYSLKKLGIL